MVPGAQSTNETMSKAIVAYASARIIKGKLPPRPANELFMIGDEVFYLAAQLARAKKVQSDIEIATAPLYLFFDILQAKTHLFLLTYAYSNLYYNRKKAQMIG